MFSWRSRKGERDSEGERIWKGEKRERERAKEYQRQWYFGSFEKSLVVGFQTAWIILHSKHLFSSIRVLTSSSCFSLPSFFPPHCYSNHDLIPNRGSLGHQCCNREWEGERQMDSREVERGRRSKRGKRKYGHSCDDIESDLVDSVFFPFKFMDIYSIPKPGFIPSCRQIASFYLFPNLGFWSLKSGFTLSPSLSLSRLYIYLHSFFSSFFR